MCGRFMLDSDIEDIIRQYKIMKEKLQTLTKAISFHHKIHQLY